MSWILADFNASFSEDEAELRDSLLYHVDALLQRPLTPVAVNGPLIAQVREILNRVPLAEYSYGRIIHSPRVTALPDWAVSDNAGAGAGRVFVLRSGKPLNAGVPGIFTWAGYHNTFLPLLPTVTKDISEDSWVLGREKRGVTETLADVNKLRRDVVGLYLDEYVRRWDVMLGDIAVKPFTNVGEAVEQLGLISGPNSPLRNVLISITVQTQLSRAGATDNAEAQLAKKAGQVGQRAAGLGQVLGRSGLTFSQNEVANILGEAFGSGGGATPVDPASRVDSHFRDLHRFTLPPDKDRPAPMEAAIDKMATIYQGMIQVSNAPNQGQALLGLAGAGGGGGGGSAAAATQLRDLAKDLPGPVAAMLTSVSQSSSAVATGGASQALVTAWKTKVLPLCDEAFFNRYPFVAGSTSDVPTDDFARLLGPNGMIDGFFNENLKSFVDTSVKPWKWQAANQSQLQLAPGTLVQLERAAQIRESLFADPQTILVKFQLVPVSLDAGIGQITLDIAGQTLTYAHGPTESAQFRWPAANGKTLVRVTMTPASGGNATVMDMDGPWALLRMLDSIRVVPSGQPDKFRLVFSAPAGTAAFDLNASSVRNPFTLGALRAFRCPATL
jgi:type VI secretion system protein ImpL